MRAQNRSTPLLLTLTHAGVVESSTNGNRRWHVGAADGSETAPSSGHAVEVYVMVEAV